MKITKELKERFCKDCKIPIHIFEEPYFTYRIVLYNQFYDSDSKWIRFIDSLRDYDTEQDYYTHYNHVKDSAINAIKQSNGYQKFVSQDMSKFKIRHNDLPSKDVYKPSNIGKHYISIDMKQANFNTLKHYASDIFMNCDSWESFLSNFTANQHIIHSKYIRQVILGNCNAKRQCTYEKYLLSGVLLKIVTEDHIVEYDQISVFANDEIVIDVTNKSDKELNVLKEKLNDIIKLFDFPLTMTEYILHGIDGVNGYYQEIIGDVDHKYVLKCANGYNIPFIIRAFNGDNPIEMDAVFIQEGRLAKFLEMPEVRI